MNISKQIDTYYNINIMKINIDIGGVAVQKGTDYEDDKNDTYMVEFYPDFLNTIEKLKKDGHDLYFNSFCGKGREEKTRKFFRTVKQITDNIPEENWNFIRDRKFKPTICDKTQADMMIDDNLGICTNVKEKSKTKHVIWFFDKKTLSKDEKLSDYKSVGIVNLDNWKDVYNYISRA